MHFSHIKIIGGIIGICIIVLLGFFVFFRDKKVPLVENVRQTNVKRDVVLEIQETQQRAGESEHADFQELFFPITSPLEPAISYVTGVFSDSQPLETSGYEELLGENIIAVEEKTTYITKIERPLDASNPLFSKIWPDFYIQYLRNMQDVLVQEGIYTEKKYDFALESEIFTFLDDFIAFLLQNNVLTSQDADRLRKGLREDLPWSQDAELYMRERAQRILKFIFAFFAGNEAYAQFSFPFSPGGDCYKDLAPLNPVPGVNLWAPCCDCEVDFGAGPVPIGCLNAVCAAWPNAIWDPATGICGCG